MSVAISPAAVVWHLSGEHGISSEAIFDQMTFGTVSRRWGSTYPSDPADFIRCEKLLRAVPEFRVRLPEMAAVHPVWAGLVARWDEIEALIEADVPGYIQGATGRASRAYALMDSVIQAGRESRP